MEGISIDDKCGRGRPRLEMLSNLIVDTSHVIMKKAASDKEGWRKNFRQLWCVDQPMAEHPRERESTMAGDNSRQVVAMLSYTHVCYQGHPTFWSTSSID